VTPRPRKTEYLSPREAAEYLTGRGYPVSGRTIARMCASGQLACVTSPGGFKRIRTSVIEQFADIALDTLDNSE